MNPSRRNMLLSSLFGAGCVGLRALATGIPASILLNPRRALAGPCATGTTPQFVIMNISDGGDPINANAPGSYIAGVGNAPALLLPTATTTLGGKPYTAAQGWSTLPAASTSVWHVMTDNEIHPHLPEVLSLNGGVVQPDMFPSWLSRQLQPCLGTLQGQPISLGAGSPVEALSYQGLPLAPIAPQALQATLTNNSTDANLPKVSLLTSKNLLALRDDTLAQLNNVYLQGASKAQVNFVNSMVLSEQQVRAIPEALLANLGSITGNGPSDQVTAAVALIQMKIAPVITIHIPFGGDNHVDTGLKTESAQTLSGLQTLNSLITLLGTTQMPGTNTALSDLVSVISLNVFGRTLSAATSANGRGHNENHQVSFAIGKPFKGGVYGGLVSLGSAPTDDFGALPIESATGAGSSSGDVKPVDTLQSFAMTVAVGVGVPATTVTSAISSDSTYTSSGLDTAKVISAALA